MTKGFLFAFLWLIFALVPLTARADHDEVYDRVIKSGTIKCGYFLWPPFIEKDLTTGKMSGFFPELMEEIGKELSLKVEWAEEISWAGLFEGYASGHYDMICGPVYSTPGRARASDFTIPLFYATTYLYARTGDKRFDGNYDAANNPSVKIATIDGEYSQVLAHDRFPKAQALSSTGLTDGTQPLLDVATGKADIAPQEPTIAKGFMDKNPGKIKRVSGDPVTLFPLTFPVPQGEYKLKRMMDVTIENLEDKGYMDGLLKKYLPPGVTFYPVQNGYKSPAQEK